MTNVWMLAVVAAATSLLSWAATATPPATVTLTPAQKACRVWWTNHGLVHGPTLQGVGPSADVGAAFVAKTCVVGHWMGEVGVNDCQVKCAVMGADAELAAEPIRAVLEANATAIVTAEVSRQLQSFLEALRAADQERRDELVKALAEELPKNPSLVAGLQRAMASKGSAPKPARAPSAPIAAAAK